MSIPNEILPSDSSLPGRSSLEAAVGQMREALRTRVQQDVAASTLTPQGVASYAALLLSTDRGMPLRPAAHHQVWLQFLCETQIKRLLIIAPPESAKTTWILSAFTGAYVATFPERSVIISSSSGPIAEKRSLSLRNIIHTTAWRLTYPNLAPAVGLPWKSTQWSIAPGGIPSSGRLHPTLSAYGTGGSVVGSRADLIVADDLLDSLNTSTKHQRESLRHWFHTILLSRLKSQIGRVVVIGTAYHHADLYSDLKREGQWVVVHMKLLSDTDKQYAHIIYPDSYTGPRLGEPIGGGDTVLEAPDAPAA